MDWSFVVCLFVCFAVCCALPELFALQNANYAKYLQNAKYVTVSLTLRHRTQRFSNMRDLLIPICVSYLLQSLHTRIIDHRYLTESGFPHPHGMGKVTNSLTNHLTQ